MLEVVFQIGKFAFFSLKLSCDFNVEVASIVAVLTRFSLRNLYSTNIMSSFLPCDFFFKTIWF